MAQSCPGGFDHRVIFLVTPVYTGGPALDEQVFLVNVLFCFEEYTLQCSGPFLAQCSKVIPGLKDGM